MFDPGHALYLRPGVNSTGELQIIATIFGHEVLRKSAVDLDSKALLRLEWDLNARLASILAKLLLESGTGMKEWTLVSIPDSWENFS